MYFRNSHIFVTDEIEIISFRRSQPGKRQERGAWGSMLRCFVETLPTLFFRCGHRGFASGDEEIASVTTKVEAAAPPLYTEDALDSDYPTLQPLDGAAITPSSR